MSRCANIVVLAEDTRQYQLIHKYLRQRGFANSQIRRIAAPVGKTQNEGFVLERYAAEAKNQRNVHYSHGLIVVIDADDHTVAVRKSQLDRRLRDADYEPRSEAEAIAIVVPSRNIETWIWYLLGNAVDEVRDYNGSEVKGKSEVASEVKQRFADYIVSGQEPFEPCPPALQDAREELLRVPFR